MTAAGSADRPEWRPYVFSRHPLAVAYRYSAGGYSFAGLLLLLFADRMRSYDAGVWWCALGMALVSPPLVMQLGMTSCSYDGDDSVLEPGARVFDLSAWRALCSGRSPVDDDGDGVV